MPNILRGKLASLQFKFTDYSGTPDNILSLQSEPSSVVYLAAAAPTPPPSGARIILDDIALKDYHLKFGNPTKALADINRRNNYLIENPQYVVSYNGNPDQNIPNWVAWQLDKSWIGSTDRATSFKEDPSLNTTNWYQVKDQDIIQLTANLPNESKYLRKGHLGNSKDRSRDVKDNLATFLTTNIAPQHQGNNGGVWKRLENDERVLANSGNELFIYAGTYGTKRYVDARNPGSGDSRSSIEILDTSGNPIQVKDNSGIDTSVSINVPEYFWKVIIQLPSYGAAIDSAPIGSASNEVDAFAFVTRNDDVSGVDWTTHRYSINQLEAFLNQDPSNGLVYDFLSDNITDGIKNQLKERNASNLPIQGFGAPLLADSENTPNSTIVSNTAIWHNSIFENNFSQICSSQIGSSQIGSSQIGIREIGATQISSNENSINQSRLSQIGSSQISIGKISITSTSLPQTSTSETSINKVNRADVCLKEISSFQISSTEIGGCQNTLTNISSNQSSITHIGTDRIDTFQIGSNQISTDQLSIDKIDAGKIGSNQFNPAQIEIAKIRGRWQSSFPESNTWEVSFPSSISSEQFFPVHNSIPQKIDNINNTAISIWNTQINQTTPIDLNFAITNLPTGQLAEATITGYDNLGRPNTATITIDHDANGVGWFVDSTPGDSSEFQRGDGGTGGLGDYYIADPNSEAAGKYDLLTTILHEMGHTKGIINGYSEFDKYIKGRQFITDTFTANLTPDGSHLDTTFHPYDLMNTSLKPGVRKLPSALNLAMIDAINSGVGSRESGVGGTISAPLTAGALLAINNGDFSTTADWNTLGATNIINGTATLTELSQKLSELTQAFIIPTGAKTLQFTIIDNHLVSGDTTKTANDAFEVALLDTNTFNPLAGTSIGLNHTDSLLNIQANGTIHKSDKVTITALGNNSSIVTIDLTQVTPTTQATLYFNLLGFGARTSTITIDDVKLFTDTQPLAVTKNDTLITNQNTPLTLDLTQLTTNDTNVTQIQVINQPTHGTLTQTPAGEYTYNPNPTYVGNDSFTYLGFGTDGQISNLATVNLTVNNLAPTIETVLIPNQINEGQTIQLKATAKDGGSSENLTYTWDLGDSSQPVIGQNITHQFVDNGTYNVVLTVTDFDGGTTQQSTQLTVDNVAPTLVVDKSVNTNINQGEAITFIANYSDSGINDTHTITWNFGDGSNPVSSVNNPSHQFTKAGNHNVTVTVTDNDGASTTDTIQVTVTNVAPTINTVNIPTNINEGSTVQLTATASDAGNDTLT